ncbi:MAG: Bcr/CflA family drug resistance efflux transporter [Confluentimicrobium sp.]|uniref:multidrug effflux MFS transporter n=1 Tax=Actibacterium sp. TaxID=1872125 RepID=UPI00050E0078|nr:multidrug effflux MFS transporter [Actibacterium sp.]KGB82365.1 multidrug MFS transporter [Rhodovulum sp. NI22]MBC58137.1 Bcr/CflA family drug resistance efflux transporter [Actibacterium sp.]|tara:strand:+ start:5863 stop:7098 length:1236 start_codon:yes stop_codon:yes gene_type:complete
MNPRLRARFLDRSTPPHLVTLVLLAGLSAMSMNIFLPSLPKMTAYFDTEYRLMQLSVALYLGVSAGLQLLIGPISDKYGRRPVILGSVVIFLVATLGCLLAPSAHVFLGFRMAQAAIVAGIVLSRAVVRDMVPAEESASMIGYVTMGMAVVPMLAPALGGVLDQLFGWKANFEALLLAGIALFLLLWADLGETARPSENSLLAQFREYPELLRSRRFWGYALTTAFASGAFFAYLGGAPYVGSAVFGLSPATLGMYFGLLAFGYMAGNFLTGRYATRLGINRMIMIGTLLPTIGLILSILAFLLGATHPLAFFGLMTSVGVGNGMVISNATSGMMSVRPALSGTASGLGGTIMIGGGAALSALAGALLVPGTGVFTLLIIMLCSSAAAVLAMLYVLHVTRIAGELDIPLPD